MSFTPQSVHTDKDLSKCLSWILRHGAIKLGLSINAEGFISVDSLIQIPSLQSKNTTINDIKRIVETNDKQRFTLRYNSRNQLEIRANQGHSIQVDALELHAISSSFNKDIIHGTYRRFWDSIKLTGLSRMNRLHIHFTSELPHTNRKKVLSGARRNCEIFIYIDLSKALGDGIQFYESSNNVILSSGDENGLIHTKYFMKVVTKSGIF